MFNGIHIYVDTTLFLICTFISFVKLIPGLYRVIHVCQDLIEEYSMVITQGEGEAMFICVKATWQTNQK